MRHLLVRLATAAFVAGLVFGLNPASAALLPKLDGLVSQTNAVDSIPFEKSAQESNDATARYGRVRA